MFVIYPVVLIAAAAAAASTGSLHATSSSSSMIHPSSTILGSSQPSSLFSTHAVGKEEKMSATLSSGMSASCSSSHGVHPPPPVGAVGPIPHMGS